MTRLLAIGIIIAIAAPIPTTASAYWHQALARNDTIKGK